MFKRFNPKAKYYDHVLNMYLPTVPVEDLQSVSASKRIKITPEYVPPEIELKWQPTHLVFQEVNGQGAYSSTPLPIVTIGVNDEQSVGTDLLDEYETTIKNVTVTNVATNETFPVTASTDTTINFPYTLVDLPVGVYLITHTYSVTDAKNVIENTYTLVYEVEPFQYGAIINWDNSTQGTVYSNPDVVMSTNRSGDLTTTNRSAREIFTELPFGLFNDPEMILENVTNIFPSLTGNGGDIDINPWGESALGLWTNDVLCKEIEIRLGFDSEWNTMKFLKNQIPRWWRIADRDGDGPGGIEIGDEIEINQFHQLFSADNIFLNVFGILSTDKPKYMFLNGGQYPTNLQRRNNGNTFIKAIYWAEPTIRTAANLLAVRNFAVEVRDNEDNLTQDWWTAGLDVEGWREDLDNYVVTYNDVKEKLLNVIGFTGIVNSSPESTGLNQVVGPRRAAMNVAGLFATQQATGTAPSDIEQLTDTLEFLGWDVNIGTADVEGEARLGFRTKAFPDVIAIPYEIPADLPEGQNLRMKITVRGYKKDEPDYVAMESTIFFDISYDPSLDPPADPFFTYVVADDEVQVMPVTPGGTFSVVNDNYDGDQPGTIFTLTPGPNVITHTLPTGETHTEIINYMPVTGEDPTFTLNPNGLTATPEPVTPNGVFTVNGTQFPDGSTIPLIEGENTIVYTTPDGTQSTQTYTPEPTPPVDNRVVKSNLIEVLLPKILPQSNIPSGDNTNWYSAIEYEIGQGSRPVNYRFATNTLSPRSIETSYTSTLPQTLSFTRNVNIADTAPSVGISFGGTSFPSVMTSHVLPSSNTPMFFPNGAPNSFDHGSSMTIKLPSTTTSTWINAVAAYQANNIDLPRLQNNQYFDVAGGRYIANTNNISDTTFKLPAAQKYVMMSNGGVLTKPSNTIIYSTRQGNNYAGIQEITQYVSNGLITFNKASGTQGTIYGFFAIVQ